MSPDGEHPEARPSEDLDADELVDGEPVAELDEGDAPARFKLEHRQSRYASPLPAPDDLEVYERLAPGTTSEILDRARAEQEHRHRSESALIETDRMAMKRHFANERAGQVIAAFIVLSVLVILGVIVAMGHEVLGFSGILIAVGAVVWATRRDPSGPSPPPVSLDPDKDEREAGTTGESPAVSE